MLKYVTNEPQFDSFEGRVRGSFESVDDGDMSYSGAAVANMPVSDSVAIRASGFYRNVGGFIDSIGTGRIRRGGRHQRFDRIGRPRVDALQAERSLLAAA